MFQILINPLLGKWTNYKYRREIYFRIGTLFEKNNKRPVSIIYQILDFWLNYDLNVNKICENLKDIYDHDFLNKIFVLNILQNLRIYITKYLRDYYCLEPIAKKTLGIMWILTNAFLHIKKYTNLGYRSYKYWNKYYSIRSN